VRQRVPPIIAPDPEKVLVSVATDHIHKEFAYRFIYLPDGKTAEKLERELRAGDYLPELEKPFLNPLPARKKRKTNR